MSDWIDIEQERPDEINEYRVKIINKSTGFMEEHKATWVPKEKAFWSDNFQVNSNPSIIAWKKIEE